MPSHRRHLIIGALTAAIVGAGAGMSATPAHAASSATLVPADVRVGDRSYAQWERAWVKWRLRLPIHAAASPRTCIYREQQAPVWFLDGDGAQPDRVTRHCHIPAGRHLLLGPWVICSTVDTDPAFRARTNAGLRRCARRLYAQAFRSYAVVVDGERLDPSGHRTATGAFRFTMPARDNILDVSGRSHGRAAVVADAALLTPLEPGRHEIRVTERYAGGYIRRVLYKITVG